MVDRLYIGFVQQRDTYPGGPPKFFENVTQPTFVATKARYALQTVLGDGVFVSRSSLGWSTMLSVLSQVYRFYKVWQNFKVSIAPSVLWLSVLTTGIISIYGLTRSSNTSSIFLAASAQ